MSTTVAYSPLSIETAPGSASQQAIGPSTDYGCEFRRSLNFESSAAGNFQSVSNSYGLYRSSTLEPKIIPMISSRNLDGAVDSETYHTNMTTWFGTGKNRSGLRWFHVEHPDGSTQLRIPVQVERYRRRPEHADSYEIILKSPVGYFEDVSQTSTTTSGGSATIDNDGNARAPAIIEAQGSTISGRNFVVTDNTGRGLHQYPLFVDSGISTTTISECFVLVNGDSVPFLMTGTSSDDDFFVIVDIPADGSIEIDLIPDTGITNPLADSLDLGHMKVDTNSTTAVEWNFDGLSDVLDNPGGRQLTWYITTLEISSGGPADIGYEVVDSGSGEIRINVETPAAGQSNNGNALICYLGSEAAASNALQDLERVVGQTDSEIRAYVRVKTADSAEWQDIWTDTNAGTTATDLDISPASGNAIIVAVGLEMIGTTSPNSGYLTLGPDGSNDPHLNKHTSFDPSYVASNQDWNLLDGTVTNSTTNQTLTFDNFIYPDGTLIIDANYRLLERGITIPGSGYFLGDITADDGVDIMSLDEGSNSFSETVNGNVTIKHRDAYEAAV